MIGFLRLAVMGFIGLSVLYFLVRIYARSLRRETLEKRYDRGTRAGEAMAVDRDEFIRKGMARYEKSLRRRLLWLVYLIPMAVMAVTIYLVNYH